MVSELGQSLTRLWTVASHVVGREPELAHLREGIDAACRGKGRVCFLVGEAGIGKSVLTRAAAADAARRAMPVLHGRAAHTASPTAYRPLAEALSSAVRATVVPDPKVLGPFRATLGRLVPEWRVDDTPLDGVVAVAEGVLRFLRTASGGRGALLVLEDLHWADPETLTIVEYLADNLTAEQVLCLVTVRQDEPSPGLELASALHARRVAPLLQLAPLDERAVAAMVRACLRSPAVRDDVTELVARAGGVPFLVEELLAAALAAGALVLDDGAWRVSGPVDAIVPHSYAENVRRRIARLGTDAPQVLVAAAVLGRRFDWSLLPAITGLHQERVLAALHEAVDAQVVSFDRADGSFRFRHALSRDAVLAGLFPPELAAISRRAVAAVQDAHPELDGGWCEVAAELAAVAGDRPRAAALFLHAARRAFARGALATAEATLDRARSLVPAGDPARLDLDEFLLQVLSLAGKRARAVDVGTWLLARLGEEPRWTRRRVEIQLRLARAAVAATRWEEAQQILERVDAGADTVPDDLAARLDAVRAQTAIVLHPQQASDLARAALAAAERLDLADVACEALEVLGRGHRHHDLAAAEAAFSRALALAERHGLTLWRARALQELGAIDMLRGRELGRLEVARELSLELGALATAAVVDVQVAAGLVLTDDPEAAVVAAGRCAELARRYRFDQTLAAALALEAYAHARARRRREMQRCIDEALSRGGRAPDIEVKTSSASALLALTEDDQREARRLLSAGLAAAARAGGDWSAVPAVGLLALLHQLDDGVDEAAEVAIPAASVHFLAAAFLRYAAAVAAGRAGAADEALAAMQEGDRLLEGHRWFRNVGRRLVAEAAIGDGWADPVPWLREALDFFEGRGDNELASACRSLLRRAGAAVPRRRGDVDVPGPLRALGVTAREHEVVTLLAAGLPNKEIAARLYLSPRTVERHIANLATKAGLARRSEVVAWAARGALGDVSRS